MFFYTSLNHIIIIPPNYPDQPAVADPEFPRWWGTNPNGRNFSLLLPPANEVLGKVIFS